MLLNQSVIHTLLGKRDVQRVKSKRHSLRVQDVYSVCIGDLSQRVFENGSEQYRSSVFVIFLIFEDDSYLNRITV